MNNLDQFNPWVPEALAGRPLKKRKENPEMLTHTYMQKARMSKYVGSKKKKKGKRSRYIQPKPKHNSALVNEMLRTARSNTCCRVG